MDSSIKWLLALILISTILHLSEWLWYGAWIVIWIVGGIIVISELWEKINKKG